MKTGKSAGKSRESYAVRPSAKLHASGVSVVKGGVHILDGVDLEIETDTLVALVWPSGAGKSTLPGPLAGLEKPTGAIEASDVMTNERLPGGQS